MSNVVSMIFFRSGKFDVGAAERRLSREEVFPLRVWLANLRCDGTTVRTSALD
jgi:hypothetical protein